MARAGGNRGDVSELDWMPADVVRTVASLQPGRKRPTGGAPASAEGEGQGSPAATR